MKPGDKNEEQTFDMYHFFSRKDVIALVIMMLLLLGVIVYKLLTGPSVA